MLQVIVEVISVVVSAIKGIKAISSFAKGLLSMNATKLNPPKKGENSSENNENENNKNNNDSIEIKKKNIVNNKKITLNNYPVLINSKNSVSELINTNNNFNNGDNYFVNIGQNLPSKNKNNDLDTNNINSKKYIINSKSYNRSIYSQKKADFIPPKYNFKFFRPNDKGVVKKIPRSEIPFKVGKDTKLLLEAKKGVMYDKNYLKGPFYEEQNMIEVIDENSVKSNDIEDLNDGSNIIINKRFLKNNDMLQNQEMHKTNKKIMSFYSSKGEKNFINIKKVNPINIIEMPITLYKKEEQKAKEAQKKLYNLTSIFTLMKREQTYLRADYQSYIDKIHPNFFATIFAEIFDKIYFVKIFIFLKKFEITSIHLSLYLFYHILSLSIFCGFFTISTIKRIWEEDNFPSLKFYLLYGLIVHIIVWIIYKIFITLLDNQDRFMELAQLNNQNMTNKNFRLDTIKNNNNENEENSEQLQKNIEEKYDEIIKKIKVQTIIFYVIIILFTELCSMYLVSFFAVYTGTKKYVLKAYYISIIEIVIIKFIYGLSLGSLRIAAEVNEYESLFNFVFACDKYLS